MPPYASFQRQQYQLNEMMHAMCLTQYLTHSTKGTSADYFYY